ncbi:MAG: methionine--tRNA ligase [Candidatus Pacebacteria bacterium]|nr:methionine--tRNA ligase [Candidatus Paceibacterota bacterium]MCF7856875.1 methionine--tRNA ligase [Candidatus Paceibacterota bacterium]
MEKEKFYLTTTLPYVNASPHIGFATEIIRADVIARYQKGLGKDIFFNTGTDEHGQKIYDKATEAGKTPQEYVDGYSAEFQKIIPLLGISSDIHFVRTTDDHHKIAAQEMWRRCVANGDIYKANHQVKYCKGCELEKTDSELEDGKCPLHTTYEIEIREEENYFFRFSKYQEALLELYRKNPTFVVPEFRLKEITSFVEGGLQDFSVSRLKSKMSWGIPVPDDEDHVMYVWFDALTNYISTTGWPEKEDFGGWWPGIQFAGKDNLRQQSAVWQAMLLSAKLPTSKQIYIGGFINSGGQKMSKSLGNVISPHELVERYGTDATRYLLLRHVHPYEDTDITWERLDEWYTANLVNGLGNLTSRILKMSETYLDKSPYSQGVEVMNAVRNDTKEREFEYALRSFNLQVAIDEIWRIVGQIDLQITHEEPFKVVKEDKKKAKEMIEVYLYYLVRIGLLVEPFMPETSKTILDAIKTNKKPENLFPRLL